MKRFSYKPSKPAVQQAETMTETWVGRELEIMILDSLYWRRLEAGTFSIEEGVNRLAGDKKTGPLLNLFLEIFGKIFSKI